MKRNDIFTFTAPNGVEVTAVALDCISSSDILGSINTWICYAQNRIFTYIEEQHDFTGFSKCDVTTNYKYGEVIADYATLPDYDRMLEDYQHQIDMANDYADRTL